MPRKGKRFEEAYEKLYNLDKQKYKVKSPAYLTDIITGQKREVDVLVEYYDNEGKLRKMSIECRDRKNKEDVTWIEQLRTKKEDLELDFIIATTTYDFSAPAIIKAKNYGIIVEKAEMFDIATIENVTNDFLADLYYLKYEFLSLVFIYETGEAITYKDLIEKLNHQQQYTLKKELDNGFYHSEMVEPYRVIDQYNFDKKQFFEKTENSFIRIDGNHIFDKNRPTIISLLGIKSMVYNVQLLPFKLTLPLNDSLSVLDAESKKTKKYKARFGQEEEFVEWGYLEDEAIYHKMRVKPRKSFLRFFEGEINTNTLFPEFKSGNIDVLPEDVFGGFDFSKII